MNSIFLRSLGLAAAPDAACVTNASRTPADGTFAIASRQEGVIQVYAASCAALLHEFVTVHSRIHALHYTSFSDSLVTLESDRPANFYENYMHEEEETFLCVYHDWRERNMVRGYTLPLGVLDTPSTRRKADCVAVCSYTGRVVVATGSVLNIWQCSQGFFEHVMEIKVDMTQTDAYHVLEFVAIHGVYVAFGSSTEVRVMEVHVSSASESEGVVNKSQDAIAVNAVVAHTNGRQTQSTLSVPDDDPTCVHFEIDAETSEFESISIPLASYGEVGEESDYFHLHEKSGYSEHDESPVVLDRDEAQKEELNLAGLVKMQDVRVNQAMSYHVAEGDVQIILRRYLPSNQRIEKLQFLPETIDNHASLEARSYTRLLVSTIDHAFLYYFLSSAADSTRKQMVQKVLGSGDFKRQTSLSMRSSVHKGCVDGFDMSGGGSSRVVMHYAFSSPVTAITANSSFLFAISASTLQVWSIWSPCHHLAATRTFSDVVLQEPTQPLLLSVESLRYPVGDIAALDSYVVMLPRERGTDAFEPREAIRMASFTAAELLPTHVLEMRATSSTYNPREAMPSVLVVQQSPPSTIFAMIQSEREMRSQTRLDLLLSLYSLYRYRADVGLNALVEANEMPQTKSRMEAREAVALDLETGLYDRLACECAATLAREFVNREVRDLSRAALFFVASRMSPSKVLKVFHEVSQTDSAYREQVVQATHKYLEARVFQSSDSEIGRFGQRGAAALSASAPQGSFTRTVVHHYVQNAPEQLSRLVVDSCLVWTLDDIRYALEQLKSVRTHDPSQAKIARLVLTLRAQSFSPDEVEEWQQKQLAEASQSVSILFSYEAFCTSVDNIVRDDSKALIRLCVSHPELLVRSSALMSDLPSSPLAHALQASSPLVLVRIVESVFDSSVTRRESVVGSVLLCLKAIGACTQSSHERISGTTTTDQIARHRSGSSSKGHLVLLRFIFFVLDAFPRLHSLAARDEISEDDDELLAIRRLLGMELLRLCVDLVSTIEQGNAEIQTAIQNLFGGARIGRGSAGQSPPDWEIEYLESWCVPHNHSPEFESILMELLCRALELVHESKLLQPSDVLAVFDSERDNNFGFFLVLLSFAQSRRTIDGLRLLAEKETLVELFLPFGKSHCTTLEEWRFLIEILSSLSDSRTEVVKPRGNDELGVLESVLHYVCSTLNPEELLQVLPDDGDLALFMATIEASVRLEDARATSQRGELVVR